MRQAVLLCARMYTGTQCMEKYRRICAIFGAKIFDSNFADRLVDDSPRRDQCKSGVRFVILCPCTNLQPVEKSCAPLRKFLATALNTDT